MDAAAVAMIDVLWAQWLSKHNDCRSMVISAPRLRAGLYALRRAGAVLGGGGCIEFCGGDPLSGDRAA